MVDSLAEVRYAKTVDGGYVAYRAIGSGPRNLVFKSGFGSLAGDAVWDLPAYELYFRALARL